MERVKLMPYWILVPIYLTVLTVICALALSYRTIQVLRSVRVTPASSTVKNGRNHLLVVLGSGGHTAEMISILHTLGLDYIVSRFCGPYGRRTWVISEGDNFSATRARDFEEKIQQHQRSQEIGSYNIVIVPRARKVHQSLWSTPVSALWCLWSCVQLLRGQHRDQKSAGTRYPDLILTNGPGTAVIIVLSSLLLKFMGLAPLANAGTADEQQNGLMRAIYVESWARVKTLSLSGKILRFMVGRFLVQWKGMQDVDLTIEDGEKKAICSSSSFKTKIEYVGTVVT